MVIVSIFLVEIPLSLFAFGFEFYNPFGGFRHATLHLFDAIIIVATFVLEIVLRGKERELAELLVLLRLWRLVKLVGGKARHKLHPVVCLIGLSIGIAVGAGELEEESLKELQELKEKYSDLSDRYSRLEDENKQLRQRNGAASQSQDA